MSPWGVANFGGGRPFRRLLSILEKPAKSKAPVKIGCPTFPANNPLAAQSLMVAKLIGLRNSLGMTRQIFFCNLDGFDTHGSQFETQVTLLQQLSQAVSAFHSATQELTVDSQVTTFTASEFGPTLSPNGNGVTIIARVGVVRTPERERRLRWINTEPRSQAVRRPGLPNSVNFPASSLNIGFMG